MADEGYALDWDTQEVEDSAFVVLDPGTYQFQVNDVRRERYEGGDKIGPCPRAVVCLTLNTPSGIQSIEESLLLHSKVEFRIAKFFEGLGFQKDPETGKVPVRWNEVIGKTGWLELGVRTYAKRDGSEGKANQVNEFLPPDKWPQAQQAYVPTQAPAAAPTPTQAAMPIPTQPAPAQTPAHSTYQM